MSTLISGIPVFSLFAELDHGIFPSLNVVGQIHSMAQYDALIPAPDSRVEIERAPEAEEIRVVKNINGDYHVTVNSSIARVILDQVDQQTTSILELDVKAYPDSKPDIKTDDYYRNIIQYDRDGDRILPGIRRVGYLSTVEEYRAMEGGSVVWFESEDFVGVENTKTGDVWWATDDLAEKVLDNVRKRDEMDNAECALE
jgi:hypothetical protein